MFAYGYEKDCSAVSLGLRLLSSLQQEQHTCRIIKQISECIRTCDSVVVSVWKPEASRTADCDVFVFVTVKMFHF